VKEGSLIRGAVSDVRYIALFVVWNGSGFIDECANGLTAGTGVRCIRW